MYSQLPRIHPMLALFLKLTAVVAIAIVSLIVAAFLLKIVIVAAIVAAVIFGGFLVYSLFKRSQLPVVR
jgi:hypothetical protein